MSAELTTTNDSILPFRTDNTDIHEGMGVVERIVSLESMTDHATCPRCGYDRGRHSYHTEVGPSNRVECDHCGYIVADDIIEGR